MPDLSTLSLSLRPATVSDLDRVTTLVARSYRALLARDYDPTLLREVLPIICRPNPAVIGCGTYFIAEHDGRAIAGAGWTDFSPHGRAAPRGEGHIRQVATDPDHAGRGIGRMVMEATLASAAASGVSNLLCQSTLTAEPFYARLGFRAIARIDLRLSPGLLFPAVEMRRGAM